MDSVHASSGGGGGKAGRQTETRVAEACAVLAQRAGDLRRRERRVRRLERHLEEEKENLGYESDSTACGGQLSSRERTRSTPAPSGRRRSKRQPECTPTAVHA